MLFLAGSSPFFMSLNFSLVSRQNWGLGFLVCHNEILPWDFFVPQRKTYMWGRSKSGVDLGWGRFFSKEFLTSGVD